MALGGALGAAEDFCQGPLKGRTFNDVSKPAPACNSGAFTLSLLRSSLGPWHALPCCGPEGQVFAIGDVHGQAAALAATLDAIAAVPRQGPSRRLVFLGDLIDRGPDSLGTIDLAMQARERAQVDEVVILPGNHELMMIDALLEPGAFMTDWLHNGGAALILEAQPDCKTHSLEELAEIARAAIDPTFLSLMVSGPTHHTAGDLVFVHAGLAPGVDAEAFLKQGRFAAGANHWAWIREPFLNWAHGWGPEQSWVVVHGHTPAIAKTGALSDFVATADRVVTHQRLCLDAGPAYRLPQIGWAEFSPGRQYRVGLVSLVA
jgi:serine/threonine protein phosphatase 1